MAFLSPVPARSSPLSSAPVSASFFARTCDRTVRVSRPRGCRAPVMVLDEPKSRQSHATSDFNVSVRRVSVDGSELDAIYSVWNAVAVAEGMPPVSPDEYDAAQSTLHFVAEVSIGGEGEVVGAGRVILEGGNNVRLDRVCVLPSFRLQGIGRGLVSAMLSASESSASGVTYVDAVRGSETGFFSILGFEPVGNERFDEARYAVVRRMLHATTPQPQPQDGECIGIGLHHASLRVSDIERSLAFYGSVGFIVDEKFVTASGARACFVQGLGTRLELVECPIGNPALAGVNVDVNAGAGSSAGNSGFGFDRLVFDVTKACTDLDSYLQHIARRNGGYVNVAGPPAKQVIGNNVMAVASILDPDGMPIEFIRHEAQVPGELRTKINW